MIAAVSLYFLGAEPLQMFSLAIFVGLVAATFGSIALARRLHMDACRSRIGTDSGGVTRLASRIQKSG
jgi:preprotein translocase subunit SecF